MVYFDKICFFLLAFLMLGGWSGCAPKDATKLALLSSTQLAEELGSTHPFNADRDGDGVPDRLDWDIDGDRVPNLADLFPLNPDRGSEDQDADGLPDEIDFEVLGVFKEGATPRTSQLQQEILRESKILVFHIRGAEFTEAELELLHEELLGGKLRFFFPLQSLAALVKRPKLLPQEPSRSVFNPHWKTIEVYSSLSDSLKSALVPLSMEFYEYFYATFIHEIFHAIETEHPLVFQEFYRRMGWDILEGESGIVYRFSFTDLSGGQENCSFSEYEAKNESESCVRRLDSELFPSDYSKLGPHEMFAECGAATLLWKRISNLDPVQTVHYRFSRFLSSRSYRHIHQLLLSGP